MARSLAGIQGVEAYRDLQQRARTRRSTAHFDAALDRALLREAPRSEAPSTGPLTLSRHAEARLASRGIEMSPELLSTLEGAVDQLAARGAKESLVLTQDQAFIVGVPKRTVITVMDRSEALGQVFTNIDSTFVAS